MDVSLISVGVVNCVAPNVALSGADRISYACTSSSTVRFAATVLHLIVLGATVAAAVLLSEIMLRVVQQWRAASLVTAGAATAERAGTAPPSRVAACAAEAAFIAAGALAVGCARDDCARLLASAREASWVATRSAAAAARLAPSGSGEEVPFAAPAAAVVVPTNHRRHHVYGGRKRSDSRDALTPIAIGSDPLLAAIVRERLVADARTQQRARAYSRLSPAALGQLLSAAAEGTRDIDDLLSHLLTDVR